MRTNGTQSRVLKQTRNGKNSWRSSSSGEKLSRVPHLSRTFLAKGSRHGANDGSQIFLVQRSQQIFVLPRRSNRKSGGNTHSTEGSVRNGEAVVIDTSLQREAGSQDADIWKPSSVSYGMWRGTCGIIVIMCITPKPSLSELMP